MSFFRDPKRLIATIIAGVAGLIVLVDFAVSVPDIDQIALMLINWAALLAAFALVVGLLSISASHFNRVWQRQADWGYSLILLVSMLIVIISGTIAGVGLDEDGTWTWTVLGQGQFPPTLIDPPIQTLFTAIYQPLAASFLALLAFFSLSAALRALQRRTTDALVIIGVALVVLTIAAVPEVGELPVLRDSVQWIENFVVLAGARGLLIGVALGALVAGVRILLGFDQPYLDR
ncbi:MAG: hypothetical protein GFH27_549285n242 [Chloroflexi bacterium AL-W]|nr:hypothetical protein [Chloroflexi bacterium AL-N1]NOK65754.1 hypothetical protein [Chloroflexi bacterium AL-N10]NOK74305.1 hypothetical protein [Chloroflexi bacterium AL-N5]NOK80787.1 hypothetical protein [Chloroflexi bacterium AL-W]NOK88563.1 hypothetical protein [Chloroflexi bacterium AL-N15]